MNNSNLSPLTKALINVYTSHKPIVSSTTPKIQVSRTISAAAFLLEKIRNSIEFRDEALIRRAAIERILRRRLILNPEGKDIAELLVRELIWAKYLPSGGINESIIPYLQETIDKYMSLRHQLLQHVRMDQQNFYSDWLFDLASCEIEYRLSVITELEAFINYMYQLLRPAVTVNHRTGEERDIQVYIAISRAFAKADEAHLRYQLFKLYVPGIEDKGREAVSQLLPRISAVIRKIESQINHSISGRLHLFARRQSPPFRILKDVMDNNRENIAETLSEKNKRKEAIWSMCAIRYGETGKRLQRLAIRSIIYVFITKMMFALLIEVPADRYLLGKVDLIPLGINTIFPPVLMFFVTLVTTPPGEDNTERIFNRIEELIHQTPKEVDKKVEFSTKKVTLKPILTFFFTIIYGFAFVVVFGTIAFVLTKLHFTVVSQIIFVFFLSVITFFGYRIRQTAREYRYEEREGLLSPVVDFFLLPILHVGQWLSNEIARLNFITYIFDFFLEIPLKGMLEIFEEWFSFMRRKKEEIT